MKKLYAYKLKNKNSHKVHWAENLDLVKENGLEFTVIGTIEVEEERKVVIKNAEGLCRVTRISDMEITYRFPPFAKNIKCTYEVEEEKKMVTKQFPAYTMVDGGILSVFAGLPRGAKNARIVYEIEENV